MQEMRVFATDVDREVAWSVYLLCMSVNPPCKTDEPIEMHAGFWKQTRVGPDTVIKRERERNLLTTSI